MGEISISFVWKGLRVVYENILGAANRPFSALGYWKRFMFKFHCHCNNEYFIYTKSYNLKKKKKKGFKMKIFSLHTWLRNLPDYNLTCKRTHFHYFK